jgi:restriction system protein
MDSSTNAEFSGVAIYVPKVVWALRELGGKAKASSVRDMIVDQMSAAREPYDTEELATGEAKFQNEIRWARMHLVNAGKLEPVDVSGRGVWQLTTAGWNMPLDAMTAAAICGKSTGPSNGKAETAPSVQDDLPGIEPGFGELQAILTNMQDAAFERLCAAIMMANDADNPTVTGKSNDHGIDGTAVFALDALKLITFRVAWQCKRYSPSNKVAPSEIRDFRGSLDQGIQHGIFFTTSTFTTEAELEARAAGKIPINLVNIDRLIYLLKTKGMGVATCVEKQVQIDVAFFEKFKHAPGDMPLFKPQSAGSFAK